MNSYEEAKERIPSQLDKLIRALKDAGDDGLTNIELSKICLRYDSRLSDLRRKGFLIETESIGKSLYRYYLRKTPSNIKFFPNAKEEFLQAVDEEEVGDSENVKQLLDKMGFTVIRKHGWYKNKMIH
jgi:hypothetical protein